MIEIKGLTAKQRRALDDEIRKSFVSSLMEQLANEASANEDVEKTLVIFKAALEIVLEAKDKDHTSNVVHLVRSVARIAFNAGKLSKKDIDDLMSESQRERSQLSADARRKSAEAGWHVPALKLMKEARAANNGATLDDLSDYVLANWRAGKKPSRASLKKQAANWISAGKLPPKK